MTAAPESRPLPLAAAEKIAQRVQAELAPFCARIAIAGSIRRRRPYCGDVDLVCLANTPADLTNILNRCGEHARPVKRGEQYCVFQLANGFQLDLWLANWGEFSAATLFEESAKTAPSNFGVLLLARTGSAMFNVWLAQEATARGLHFNPHRGIQQTTAKNSRVIAATEEAEIFSALGLEFIPPEKRER